MPPIERCTIKEMRNGVTFEASLIIYTHHDSGTGKMNVGRMQCAIQKKMPYQNIIPRKLHIWVVILPQRFSWFQLG